jgi:hypothetical protein
MPERTFDTADPGPAWRGGIQWRRGAEPTFEEVVP